MFNCELGEVASQIKGEGCGSQEEFLTVMAKAYQVIYDRIEEDFADPDREPTWLRQDDGTYVEETKQDRIDVPLFWMNCRIKSKSPGKMR